MYLSLSLAKKVSKRNCYSLFSLSWTIIKSRVQGKKLTSKRKNIINRLDWFCLTIRSFAFDLDPSLTSLGRLVCMQILQFNPLLNTILIPYHAFTESPLLSLILIQSLLPFSFLIFLPDDSSVLQYLIYITPRSFSIELYHIIMRLVKINLIHLLLSSNSIQYFALLFK